VFGEGWGGFFPFLGAGLQDWRMQQDMEREERKIEMDKKYPSSLAKPYFPCLLAKPTVIDPNIPYRILS
jgi:hypothetical protein